MPAILTNNLSVINAENFVDSFINGDSNIYIAVGSGYKDESDDTNRGDKTKDQYKEWTDESNPPTPIDTDNTQKAFRENIIGIKRVQINNIMLMMPRIEWQAGSTFKPRNSDSKAGVRAHDYFCINSNNEVWECIFYPGNPTTANAEPFLANTNQNTNNKQYEIETADGYIWRFKYDVTASMVNSGMLLENWMPVPFNKHGKYPGGMLTIQQKEKGDVNANRTFGAYRVLVTVTLKDEADKIPYTSIYRQIGLIVDPLDTNGNFLTGDLYSLSEFNNMSGELVYLENKSPIHREEGQNETLNLLLIF